MCHGSSGLRSSTFRMTCLTSKIPVACIRTYWRYWRQSSESIVVEAALAVWVSCFRVLVIGSNRIARLPCHIFHAVHIASVGVHDVQDKRGGWMDSATWEGASRERWAAWARMSKSSE